MKSEVIFKLFSRQNNINETPGAVFGNYWSKYGILISQPVLRCSGGWACSITAVRAHVRTTSRTSRILVSVHYLLKRLVFWILILYNHKCRSSSNLGKIHLLFSELGSFSTILFGCLVQNGFHYLLRDLVYWIHILYTGI